MNPDKPGYATSEFWLAVLPQVLQIASLIGILTTDQAAVLLKNTEALVAAVLLFVVSFWPIVEYIKSRTQLKVAAKKDK